MDDHWLKCQICGDKLPFNPSCPCSLGEHLVRNHPKLDMTHFTLECQSRCDQKANIVNNPQCRMGLCTPKRCPAEAKHETRSGIFKTTVETWKPGPLNMVCSVCGEEDRPCIRKQRDKVAYTSLGAMCMLSCWPICFLPFLMPQGSQIHLHCKHCGAFLGEYNRKTGSLTTTSPDVGKKLAVPSNMC